MPNNTQKYSFLFLSFFFFFSQLSYGQNPTKALLQADSLFNAHQYGASFKIYKNILQKEAQYSPKMLLKMAYIQEIFRDYTATMYYLHLYYDKMPSRTVLKKMEDLAQRQRFSGYAYSDLEFFRTQFNKRYFDILQGLLMVAVVVVILLYRRRTKGKKVGQKFQVGFMIYLLFIGYYINFLDFGKKGIIRRSNVAIMSAPAAGASWIATANAGHKIDLRAVRDIWYETEWNGRPAFIRKQNVIELP